MIGMAKVLMIFENRIYRTGISSIMLLKEDYRTLMIGLIFKPFSPFFEVFNQRIGELVTSGLTDYWFKNELNPQEKKRIVEDIGPQVLTMDHLEIGFIVCLVPLTLSFIIALIEISISILKRKLET